MAEEVTVLRLPAKILRAIVVVVNILLLLFVLAMFYPLINDIRSYNDNSTVYDEDTGSDEVVYEEDEGWLSNEAASYIILGLFCSRVIVSILAVISVVGRKRTMLLIVILYECLIVAVILYQIVDYGIDLYHSNRRKIEYITLHRKFFGRCLALIVELGLQLIPEWILYKVFGKIERENA